MAQVPMTDAQPDGIASAAHNNAIIDNVQDHEARLVPVETRTTDTATNGGHGNVRLSDRLGTGVTNVNTATSQLNALDARLDTAEPKITTLETLTGHASHGNIALDTRVDALESGGSVDLAGKVIARGLRTTARTVGALNVNVPVLRIDGVATTGNRLYQVSVASNLYGNGQPSARLAVKIYYSTSGQATVSSTLLGSVFGISEVTGFINMTVPFTLATNETVSFLLAAMAQDAAAANTVQVYAGSNSRYTTIDVTDAGVDPGETGTDL